MTSPFVSVAPAADQDPPAAPSNDQVAGDGWYPDIDLQALRAAFRIDTTVTPERIRESVAAAMIAVARDLDTWRAPLEAAGAANLAAVTELDGKPIPTYGGRSKLLACYDRAIGCLVAADVAERLRDIAATSAGQDRADELQTTADTHRRDAKWALCDLKGRRRSIVELV